MVENINETRVIEMFMNPVQFCRSVENELQPDKEHLPKIGTTMCDVTCKSNSYGTTGVRCTNLIISCANDEAQRWKDEVERRSQPQVSAGERIGCSRGLERTRYRSCSSPSTVLTPRTGEELNNKEGSTNRTTHPRPAVATRTRKPDTYHQRDNDAHWKGTCRTTI